MPFKLAKTHDRGMHVQPAIPEDEVITDEQHGDKTTIPGAHHEKTTHADEITEGRFGMPRMPDGTSGYVLTAKGAGIDPAYEEVITGITKLSELEIDVDKNWGAKRIQNIGAPTADTHVPRARAGDILSGRFGMARMPDGASDYFLMGKGTGVNPAYVHPYMFWGNKKLVSMTTQTGTVAWKSSIMPAHDLFVVEIYLKGTVGGGNYYMRLNDDSGEKYSYLTIKKSTMTYHESKTEFLVSSISTSSDVWRTAGFIVFPGKDTTKWIPVKFLVAADPDEEVALIGKYDSAGANITQVGFRVSAGTFQTAVITVYGVNIP